MAADRLEPLRRLARLVPGGMALGRHLRVLLDPELRTIHRLKRGAPGLLQPWTETREDRYPEVFDALAERLAGLAAPRILSFGCSTGAELRALRRRMPQARITGIDINPRALAAARKAGADPLTRLVLADRPDPAERYDAVLALAVLRHGDLEAFRPASSAAVLPFARFAGTVALLDGVLEPGGWLAIWNAHFRFADTPTALNYTADPLRQANATPQDLLYGPDDRRIVGAAPYADVLFRKRPGGDTPWPLDAARPLA
ncbi:MAG: methyltransferase [Sphingomonadales bacterium]|nr:methyltransferase [Sphingomonadales bacterium]